MPFTLFAGGMLVGAIVVATAKGWGSATRKAVRARQRRLDAHTARLIHAGYSEEEAAKYAAFALWQSAVAESQEYAAAMRIADATLNELTHA